MDDIKLPEIPGLKDGRNTTEFYLTVASYALSVLVMMGVIGNDQAQLFLKSAGDLVTAVVAVGTAIGPIVTTLMYIYSRIRAKEDATATAMYLMENLKK